MLVTVSPSSIRSSIITRYASTRFLQGCEGDGSGEFGDCCSGNCDGFALGKNAEEYDWPGQV